MMEPELSYGRFAISGPRCYGFEKLFTRRSRGEVATFKPPLRVSAPPREMPLLSSLPHSMPATAPPPPARAHAGDCEDPHHSALRATFLQAPPHFPAARTTRSHAGHRTKGMRECSSSLPESPKPG